MNKKKLLCATIAVVLATTTFAACGKKDTATPAAKNANSVAEQNKKSTAKPVNIPVEERAEEKKYEYTDADFGLIDTTTGKGIVLGMSLTDIEEVTGSPVKVDRDYRTYDGVVVKYTNDIAEVLIVASGNMAEGMTPTKYATNRGVKLGTSVNDFHKAYGDKVSEKRSNDTGADAAVNDDTANNTAKPDARATGATRYLKRDGKKIEYLGTDLTKENRPEDTSLVYLQDFIFSTEKNTVETIRIGKNDTIMGK
ncbi:MAG: hypothetical protein RSA27_04445 [Oscillospiraceae bacterium]